MKKLIVKLAALAAVVLVALFVSSWVYYSSLQVYALSTSGMPETIAVANTGNSHGLHAFDYGEYENGFNFALGSQPPEYDLSLVKKYIDRFEEGARLFVTLSYTSFWGDPKEDSQYEALTMRYMGLLDAEGLVLKSRADYYVFKYFSIVRFSDVKIGRIFEEKSERVADASGMELAELGKKRAEYHASLAYSDGKLKEMYAPSVEAVREILAICREHNVAATVITPPYTAYYRNGMPDELKDAFREETLKICGEYGVEYLDYSSDARFTDEYFTDSDHLNAEGAKMFTAIALADAQKQQKTY